MYTISTIYLLTKDVSICKYFIKFSCLSIVKVLVSKPFDLCCYSLVEFRFEYTYRNSLWMMVCLSVEIHYLFPYIIGEEVSNCNCWFIPDVNYSHSFFLISDWSIEALQQDRLNVCVDSINKITI